MKQKRCSTKPKTAVICTSTKPTTTNRVLSKSVIVAALASCATLATLATSISSRVWTGDTAEAQTVPYILGIAHPTGFPAFTLLGWLFTHVFAFGTVAWRMNAFCALCVALTAGGVALLAAELECNPIAACAAALAFSCGVIVRSEAVLANAHALSNVCTVYALVAAIVFARCGDRRALFAACGCAGLGLATHPEAIFVLPAILVALAWQWREVTRRSIAFAALALLAPLLLYLYLPVRSEIVAARHLDPTAAAPLFGAGSIDWDTDHPRTLDGFLDEVLGRQTGAAASLAGTLDLRALPNALEYWLGMAEHQFDVWLLFAAMLGAIALAQVGRRALSVVAAGTLGGVLFAYGYRLDADITWYVTASFAVTAAVAAACVRLRVPRVNATAVGAIASAALVAIAALALRDRSGPVPVSPPGGGQAIIDRVARDVPDGAIVVAAWYAATALEYGVAIEHALGSRTIVAGLPAQYAQQYPEWTRSRRVIIFAGGLSLVPLSAVPQPWLRALPTGDFFYRVFEVKTDRDR